MLFVAIQLTQRAPAQQSAGNRTTVASAPQIPAVSTDTNSAARALPVGNCYGAPLWDQYNSAATEPPVGIGSQKFELAMAAFDDQAADDFVLTSMPGRAILITVCA
jgi:hypothetical protein